MRPDASTSDLGSGTGLAVARDQGSVGIGECRGMRHGHREWRRPPTRARRSTPEKGTSLGRRLVPHAGETPGSSSSMAVEARSLVLPRGPAGEGLPGGPRTGGQRLRHAGARCEPSRGRNHHTPTIHPVVSGRTDVAFQDTGGCLRVSCRVRSGKEDSAVATSSAMADSAASTEPRQRRHTGERTSTWCKKASSSRTGAGKVAGQGPTTNGWRCPTRRWARSWRPSTGPSC